VSICAIAALARPCLPQQLYPVWFRLSRLRTLIGSLHSSIKLTRIPSNSSPICLAFGGETFVKLVQLHACDLAFPIQDAETTLANAFG